MLFLFPGASLPIPERSAEWVNWTAGSRRPRHPV